MYLYIELWKGRDTWTALDVEARKAWMDKTLAGLQEHLEKGNVEVIGFAQDEGETPHSAGYDFAAVWRMSDKDAAVTFENFVEDAGWHDYFEQVNFRGRELQMDEFVSGHMSIGKSAAA